VQPIRAVESLIEIITNMILTVKKKGTSLAALLAALFVPIVCGAAFLPPNKTCMPTFGADATTAAANKPATKKCMNSEDEDANQTGNLRSTLSHEMIMEELARIGADRLATLPVAERVRRAMLAEQIEDEIFKCTERLENLLTEEG
jgi:hypothetical protein